MDVVVEDWSDDVFDGFCEFMKVRSGGRLGAGGKGLGLGRVVGEGKSWKGLLIYAKVVQWFGGKHRRRLLFVGVSARMKSKVS